jgi:hypothetical protein
MDNAKKNGNPRKVTAKQKNGNPRKLTAKQKNGNPRKLTAKQKKRKAETQKARMTAKKDKMTTEEMSDVLAKQREEYATNIKNLTDAGELGAFRLKIKKLNEKNRLKSKSKAVAGF